jgi:hypothetical protein
LWRDPVLRTKIAEQQLNDVEEYDMIRVARLFLQAVGRVTPSPPDHPPAITL